MNIITKTKNLELTASLENYITRRIAGLKKLIGPSAQVSLHIEKENLHHKKGEVFKTEALLRLEGSTIVASATGSDLGKTVTRVRDELKQEIKKHKLKSAELARRVAKKSRKESF